MFSANNNLTITFLENISFENCLKISSESGTDRFPLQFEHCSRYKIYIATVTHLNFHPLFVEIYVKKNTILLTNINVIVIIVIVIFAKLYFKIISK